MSCRACGTQLTQGATNCPRCGTASSYYYSTTEAGPNDPTVVSSPDPIVQPPPPPTVYGSPLYQSPYEPYHIAPITPPPPSPPRPGKRTGIIVGVVLFVLLLSGGGVFAWLRFSTASANFTANGAFTVLDSTTTGVAQNGQDTIASYIEHGEFTGDLTGSYTLQGSNTVHPDKTGTGSGMITCTCTVKGKSGTLRQSTSYTIAADGSFQGQVFDFQGTGELASLQGQGTFQGKGNNGTFSDQLHFDG